MTISATRWCSAVVVATLMYCGSTVSAASIELIQNGSFETGTFAGWTTSTTGTPFVDWNVSTAGAGSGFFPGTAPQDGSYDAWNGFDGAGPMTFSMYQDILIPATASSVVLSWDDRLQWNFELTSTATAARLYDVQLVDPTTNALLASLFSFSTGVDLVIGDTGWTSRSADLTAFAGQSVRLLLTESIPENFTGPGQAEFDAISITATAVPEPASLSLLALGGLVALRARRHRRGNA